MQATAIPEFETRHRGAIISARNAATEGSLYDAGSTGTRRTAMWRAPTSSANQAILANLTTLRDRSRAATRNDGYAKGIIDKLVTNIIGTGIKPMSLASDPAVRASIQALWLRWTDYSDADGVLDYYGQQGLAVRTWLEGGESFTRLRARLPKDGLAVPLQLQVLEPELCPHTHNLISAAERIRAGIVFDALGRRVQYCFHPSRPELDDFDATQLRRVPADLVCHLFQVLRAGQLRGLPRLTQALISLYELDQYDDATLVRQKLANLFAGFIKRPAQTSATETYHPLTGAEVETSEDGKPMLSLEPGIFQELDPGEEVEFSDPPDATGYGDFMQQQLRGACAAAGVPYEVVTGDMRGVNDRTARVLLHEFRRAIQMEQHQTVAHQWCRPVWSAWLYSAIESRALPISPNYLTDPALWNAVSAVKWVPQGWPYINPVQDVEAARSAVRAGLTSRTAEVSARGEDAEVIDAEQRADNERADRLGLVYDTDPRKVSNAGLTQARPAGSEIPGEGATE